MARVGKETFLIEDYNMKASETCRIHLQVTSPKNLKDFEKTWCFKTG
jgi:hypothetical protein